MAKKKSSKAHVVLFMYMAHKHSTLRLLIGYSKFMSVAEYLVTDPNLYKSAINLGVVL